MIDIEVIRRLNNYDADRLIGVLEINEDRLYHWLVLGSATVVRENLGGAIELVRAPRAAITSERPDYVSPFEAVLPS
jgi:hypothetical protein